jgi:beta-lactam-binding protein with PASTA domain
MERIRLWTRPKLVAVVGMALALGLAPPATASPNDVDGQHESGVTPLVVALSECGSAPCWTEFTVDGNAPDANLVVELSNDGSNIMLQLTNAAAGPFSLYRWDIASLLPNGNESVIHLVLNLGSYNPVVFATTGDVQSYVVPVGTANTFVHLDVKPTNASWMFDGCMADDCGDDTTQAAVDYKSMVLGNFSDLGDAPPDPGLEEWLTAMDGVVVSTNAQAFVLPPTADPVAKTLSVQIAAAHLTCNAVDPAAEPPVCGTGEPNMGFFKFFIPDALLALMGITDPTTVAQGDFTMTNSNGGTVKFKVIRDDVAGGVWINSTEAFSFSAPTFTIKAKAKTPAKCTVPDVVGKKLADAKKALTKAKCQTGKVTQAYSDTVPKGKVISQSKAPGTKLAKGTKVNLVVSKGKPPANKCLVPDVVGKKLADAKQALTKAKCQTGKVTQAYSDTVPKGQVISQSQDPGKVLAKGTKVNLAVSKGKPPANKCVVPDVVGKKLASAKQALTKAKCQTGKVTQAYSNGVAKGQVISQSQEPDKVLAKGTKVNLVVSKGKKPK